MLSALLGATSALVDGSRSAVLRRASAPRCAATDCPLSNLNCPFGTTSPPAPPPSAAVAESLERVAESLESSLQSSLGIERPLACVAGEAAIDAIVQLSGGGATNLAGGRRRAERDESCEEDGRRRVAHA